MASGPGKQPPDKAGRRGKTVFPRKISMNIAVIGPGALGCLLAARLFAAGEPVCLVDYRPERARALREQGILFTDLDGSREVLSIPVVLPGELAPVDLTILTVKAHQTAAAARHLPELLASGGLALTLQNGLGNLEHPARRWSGDLGRPGGHADRRTDRLPGGPRGSGAGG